MYITNISLFAEKNKSGIMHGSYDVPYYIFIRII